MDVQDRPGQAPQQLVMTIELAATVRLPMGENLNRSGPIRVNIMREIEGSLGRLQTDCIDLYQVDGWDSNTPLEETLRTLDDLVRQGKVRHIGLSNLMSWQAATAIMLQERLRLEKYVTAQMRSPTDSLFAGRHLALVSRCSREAERGQTCGS
jgi:aryl-alcohol dehydrogenase-like predicted oxidoreductase